MPPRFDDAAAHGQQVVPGGLAEAVDELFVLHITQERRAAANANAAGDAESPVGRDTVRVRDHAGDAAQRGPGFALAGGERRADEGIAVESERGGVRGGRVQGELVGDRRVLRGPVVDGIEVEQSVVVVIAVVVVEIAEHEAAARAEVVVEAARELVIGVGKRDVVAVPVSGQIGKRKEVGGEIQRDWIETRGGDDVVRERLIRERIAHRTGGQPRLREIALALERSGHNRYRTM